MKKDFRKIVIETDTWYWKVKGDYNTYINMYNEKEKPFKMYSIHIDSHYHKDDGSIVNFSITPSFIEHIIRKDLYKYDKYYGYSIEDDVIKNFVETIQSKKIREKKLQRIVNG